jgi:sec-independent protein translocase protein TatA
MKAGIWELLIVLAIALLIFGPKALPKLGSAMGKTIGNFKKGLSEDDEEQEKVKKAETSSEKSDNSGEE